MISEVEKSRLHTGFKQAVRALSDKNAEKLIIAEDCEDRIKDELSLLAQNGGVSVTYVPTMKELGAMCGIEVGASCAVVLK